MLHSPAAASDIAAARGGNAGRLTTVVDGRHRGATALISRWNAMRG